MSQPQEIPPSADPSQSGLQKESYEDRNRRENYDTAYPSVSVLFSQETVNGMNWKAVFGF